MGNIVEKGELVRSKVIDINFDGRAVLKKNNFTIFTDRGVYGDELEVKIVKLKKNYALAKTTKLLKRSEDRIDSKCKYSNLCGGCQFQELDYNMELELKEENVRKSLEKIGGIESVKINNIIGAENIYRYRNNMQIPLAKVNNKVLIGHYEKFSHKIVDNKECLIQKEVADRIVAVLREFIEEENISIYNRRYHRGLIRHVVIRSSEKNMDTMVIIVINGERLEKVNILLEKLKEIDEFKSLYININKRRTSLVKGDKYKHIYGCEKIIDQVGNLKYKLSPESFFQVNTKQTENLYNKVKEFAELKGNEIIVDLYSGIGTISLYLADSCKKVIGVEIIKKAVEDAKENAKLNKINNAYFIEARSENILPELEKRAIFADVLIVDPPRKGCELDLLNHIISSKVNKLIYVSCNPSTLARDLKYLEEYNYKIKKIQPVDMFPQTNHVECIALIQRKTI